MGGRHRGAALEACGTALVTVGGWLGGTLVYRNQIAVDHRYAEAGQWDEAAVTMPERVGRKGLDVGADDDLEPGQMKLLDVGGRRIVLARTEDGYRAFDDRCTHKGGSLADGTLIGCTVQCPWHGSQFDARTGRVVHGPAEEKIGTHRVQVKHGRVLLHLRQR
jgi:nitrite reductase/ring-hydroxylating ferredoxin subunit